MSARIYWEVPHYSRMMPVLLINRLCNRISSLFPITQETCQGRAFNRGRELFMNWANFKTSPFAQYLRQAQILILEILNVFLWLIPPAAGSPSLIFNPAVSGKHFETVSNIMSYVWVAYQRVWVDEPDSGDSVCHYDISPHGELDEVSGISAG